MSKLTQEKLAHKIKTLREDIGIPQEALAEH